MKPLFIFSLPRSGSTLLQRILATSDKISTASEPWILLPLIYTLKQDGVISEYWHKLMVRAIADFFNGFPNQKKDYFAELRKFIMRLYSMRTKAGSLYFLDKTPRYHIICDDIIDLFPDSKFIFLWRNPLAVVSSIINTWGKGRWKLMYHKVDIYLGVIKMIETFIKNKAYVYSLKYEDLLENPSLELANLSKYLEIEFNESMLNSFSDTKLIGRLGDRIGSKKYHKLNKTPLDAWQMTYNNLFRVLWARRYLSWIGDYRLALMGYDKMNLIAKLEKCNKHNFKYAVADIFMVLFHELNSRRMHLCNTRKLKTFFIYN